MLKDLIRAQERGGLVVPILEEQALLAGKLDSMKRRRDVFHPSEVAGDSFCPRAWVLGVREPDLYQNREVGARLQWVFDTGTALHSLVQERLGASGMLFGQWTCTRWCLDERCTFFGFKPACESCPGGTPHKMKVVYQEVRVADEDLNLEGRTDGVLVLPKGKYGFEFKTMNSRAYATLAEPMDAHKEQAVLYIDTLERRDQVLVDELVRSGMPKDHEVLKVLRMPYAGTIITYMNKDTQEFREFLVPAHTPLRLPSGITIRGDGWVEDDDWIADKKSVLLSTLAHRDAGTLPERLDVCTSKTCTRAKKCFARTACFDEKE